MNCPCCGATFRLSVQIQTESYVRESLDHASSRGRFDLTPAESRIVDLACEGLTNKQIAYEVGTTEQAIKNKFSNYIFPKFGCNNRAEMIRTVLVGK